MYGVTSDDGLKTYILGKANALGSGGKMCTIAVQITYVSALIPTGNTLYTGTLVMFNESYFTCSLVNIFGESVNIGYNDGTWTFEKVALNSNVGKVVTNGSVTQGHIYCIHLSESTIANTTFEIIYNPNDNQGIQKFSVCLTNGTNIYCCVARISLSNGQLSISDAYRKETGASGAEAWNVSIRTIRMIA